MSGSVEFYILAAPALVLAAPVIAVVAIADRLQHEYLSAQAEGLAKQAAREKTMREAIAVAQSKGARTAERLRALLPDEDVTPARISYVLGQVDSLERFAAQLGDEQISARVEALARDLDPLDESSVEQLSALWAAVQSRIPRASVRQTESVVDERLRSVVSLLEDPIFAGMLVTETRQDIQTRLAQIRDLAPREPAVALQALELLEKRARQAMDEASSRARRFRTLSADTVARLAAIRAVVLDERLLKRADDIQSRLNQVARGRGRGAVPQLEQIAEDSQQLFEECQEVSQEQVGADELEAHVSQALAGLSYQVERNVSGRSSGKRRLLVPLDHRHGVEFNVDGCRASAEMVAFNESYALVTPDAQESACDLVDAVLQGAGDSVRERCRRHFEPGHQLRVVKRPVQAISKNAAAARRGTGKRSQL